MTRAALAAVAAALLLPAAATGYSTHPSLDEVAGWLAQRPAEVRCLTPAETLTDPVISFWGASAYVEIVDDRPSQHTVFGHGLCEKLLALHDGSWQGRYSLSGVAWAVLALTHESGHLRGWAWWKSEAKVNCWALRHVRYTAERLGASPDLAWAMRSWAFYWYRKQPPEYRLAGCRVPYP